MWCGRPEAGAQAAGGGPSEKGQAGEAGRTGTERREGPRDVVETESSPEPGEPSTRDVNTRGRIQKTETGHSNTSGTLAVLCDKPRPEPLPGRSSFHSYQAPRRQVTISIAPITGTQMESERWEIISAGYAAKVRVRSDVRTPLAKPASDALRQTPRTGG